MLVFNSFLCQFDDVGFLVDFDYLPKAATANLPI